MDTFSQLIGKRIKIAREGSSMTQETLAHALGLKDRQSVSSIEAGERKVTPEELLKAAEFMSKPIDFFTDPYVVAESSGFSYRATTLDANILKQFAANAERLISSQRRFRILLGETSSPIHSQLSITKSTSFNVATLCGERTAASWGLGPVPAKRLREVAEEKLGISILFVDGSTSVSGAACRLEDGDVILINRRESEGRRNFNIGHELFHLLTWQEMPPPPLDYESENGGQKKSRCEQLADCYSVGLLMPSEAVKERWAQKNQQDFSDWLAQHASEMLVSRAALYWRLVNLGLIDKDEQPLPASAKNKPTTVPRSPAPQLYSRSFVTRLQQVLDRGHLSVIRATEILDCSLESLVELLKSYNLEVSFPH